jgi:chromosomal replication initiation ATPase DnaA
MASNTKEKELVRHFIKECEIKLSKVLGYNVFVQYFPETFSITNQQLQEIICQESDVAWEQIISPARKREIVIPRHLYCFFARKYQKRTVNDIGNELGDRHHTTVISAIRCVNEMLETQNDQYVTLYQRVLNRVNKISGR